MLQTIFFAALFPLLLSVVVHEDPGHTGTITGYTISSSITGSLIFQPLIGYITIYKNIYKNLLSDLISIKHK